MPAQKEEEQGTYSVEAPDPVGGGGSFQEHQTHPEQSPLQRGKQQRGDSPACPHEPVELCGGTLGQGVGSQGAIYEIQPLTQPLKAPDLGRELPLP